MSIKNEPRFAAALRHICESTDYLFFTKSWRGLNAFSDPWFDFASMQRCIDHCDSPHKETFRLLALGIGAKKAALCAELDPADVDLMLESGIWRGEEDRVETNNYVVVGYQGLLLLTEINPWFPTCTNPDTDVYIGSDSFRLAENITFQRGAAVLDLCSGTGIQGLLAARSAAKVVSVELNEKAVPVTLLNIRLNGLEDRMEVRQGDLYTVLKPEERFDCIYANPPFIPMTDDVSYPICGAGGEDGLTVLNRIADGAGKVLNPGGKIVLFCECLGNAEEVFFDRRLSVLGAENGWRITELQVNRLEGDYQILRLAGLTRLFNRDGFDEAGFIQHLQEIYKRLGATYLYHLVYHIRADGAGTGNIVKIAQYNPWDMADTAQVLSYTGENTASKGLWKDGKQIGSCNRETERILSVLREGKTLRETAEALWPEVSGKKKYAKEGYPAFLYTVMQTALHLEQTGAVSRGKL